MENKQIRTDEVRGIGGSMTRKQYIAAAVCAVFLAALFWGVPALVEFDALLWAAVIGGVCVVGMAIAVLGGGLTDVSGE